jgi:ribonuclease BN (tRNA processing enzyme)
MQVRVLGAHNLEAPGTRHTCFLIDGVLAIDAGSLATALNLKEQGNLRAILLTHHHFDHIRDLPTLGLATLDHPLPIDVYGLPETLAGVRAHLLDGDVYPDLTQPLNDAPPRYRFHQVTPGVPFAALSYQVKPITTHHPVPSVGYLVRAASGDCVGYTGDTGGDLLPFFQDEFSPRLLFVDVTFPNRLQAQAKLSGHLIPALLRHEVVQALKSGARLPTIVPIHVSLLHREEVQKELAGVGAELGLDLTPATEDMLLA